MRIFGHELESRGSSNQIGNLLRREVGKGKEVRRRNLSRLREPGGCERDDNVGSSLASRLAYVTDDGSRRHIYGL